MLTPGVAGSLTMMITNALAVNFEMSRAWTGLVLSFVFGLLVLVSSKALLQRFVYYVLNSLVIFCVAVGANGIGTQHIALLGFDQAFAQTAADSTNVSKNDLEYCANLSSAVENAQKQGAANDQILKLIQPCQSVSRDILTGLGPNNDVVKVGPGAGSEIGGAVQSKFFAPWRF